MEEHGNLGGSNELVRKWEKALDGIEDPYTRRVTATLLENQAKAIISQNQKVQEEALTPGATTVGQLGTFQKFAFPMVRRVFPELLFNKIGSIQPMPGPTSQVFYLGSTRAGNIGGTYSQQTLYSAQKLTYRGLASQAIGSRATNPPEFQDPASGLGQFGAGVGGVSGPGLDIDDVLNGAGFDVSNVMNQLAGGPSSTYGGGIASFPDPTTTNAFYVSAGEQLRTSGIPEMSLHIQQQAVVARTKKMRALWTLEASQDIKAYHDLNLEGELTELLSKEISLEVDRELIEDVRQIAYGHASDIGNWDQTALVNGNSNAFGDTGGKSPNGDSQFVPGAWNYDFHSELAGETNTARSNVFVIDFTSAEFTVMAPQHVGHRYANLLALVNLASQDIYRTTHRGPGTWLLTSPLIASFLHSAAKLEGGIPQEAGPTNNTGRAIQYAGKFAGKFDLYIDPLYPEDEILMGYKGNGPMDSGFIYCPYIPIESLPTITDPETFQPRKGIMTRYGKTAITPQSRFYRVIRIVGPNESSLLSPFARNTTAFGTSVQA